MRLYTLILLFGASLLNAQEIPSDVLSLTEKRDAAVEKIDLKYKSELEKLKLAYMKKGDRRFSFTKDGKFKGQFLKDGETFEGKWEIEDNTIQLFDHERKLMPQKFLINSADQIIFLTPTGYATFERTG